MKWHIASLITNQPKKYINITSEVPLHKMKLITTVLAAVAVSFNYDFYTPYDTAMGYEKKSEKIDREPPARVGNRFPMPSVRW